VKLAGKRGGMRILLVGVLIGLVTGVLGYGLVQSLSMFGVHGHLVQGAVVGITGGAVTSGGVYLFGTRWSGSEPRIK